jgi:hypothetical protein
MKRLVFSLTVFMLAATQPGRADWISFGFGGTFEASEIDTLTKWINDDCRPDEMANIMSFSYRGLNPLNIQVFCYKGGTGKLGKVKIVKTNYDYFFEQLKGAATGVILGFELDQEKNMVPTGKIILLTKE